MPLLPVFLLGALVLPLPLPLLAAKPATAQHQPSHDHHHGYHRRHPWSVTGFGDAGCEPPPRRASVNSSGGGGGGGGGGGTPQFVLSINAGHVGTTTMGAGDNYEFLANSRSGRHVGASVCMSFEGSHQAAPAAPAAGGEAKGAAGAQEAKATATAGSVDTDFVNITDGTRHNVDRKVNSSLPRLTPWD